MPARVARSQRSTSPGVRRGRSHPLGASVGPEGVNFSVFSRSAALVELLLFEREDAAHPSRIIPLDPERHRTYHYWHVLVPGLEPGQLYGFRAHGRFEPERGLRFDAEKLLLDPYGLAVAVPEGYSREAVRKPGDHTAVAMKSVVADPGRYDWEGDVPLQRPYPETVIYELHVRGFTRHPSSGVAPGKAGTYAGLVEKIPYLKDLGVTALELLPVFQFDPQDAPLGVNYWGYQPVALFAPHGAYSSRRDLLGPMDEFRDMVKALHRAGIEVILDVVFNHIAEGDHDGPTFCFRGLENEAYYLLERDRSRYADYTGTGNTLNANHPVVRRLIRESLRYWVEHMHVDGFRFDLASILSRDESGQPLPDPPVLWDIESDPALAGTKLIAEAWDAAGLYQVGSFARHRGVHRFVKALISFRMRRDVVVDRARLTLNQWLRRARIDWHGVGLGRPDWSDHSHSLAFTISSLGDHFRLHGMLNAYWEPLRFELPRAGEEDGGAWRRWIDTSLPSPEDVLGWEEAPLVAEPSYLVQPRSLAFLVVPLATGGG